MSHNKITVGVVVQTYETKAGIHVCIGQKFIAGDQVGYEDMDGKIIEIDTTKENYQSFCMVQP